MGFFMSLIIIILVQYGITTIMRLFNVPQLYIEIVINFALALIFTYWNFARVNRKKEVFKDISFHLNVCIWFSILTGLSMLWN